MTEPTRAKASRRPRRSASQLFIAALVVFGIAASVLLLFSENIQWLRVGLVSALWAAIIGAFAMTKYRREAVADQTKAKDLQTVYELQLAREIAARREYELNVESRVRSEVQLETSEVAALRVELAQLRNNLQVLFDGNMPTERVALRAESTRMQEIGRGRNYDSYQPAPSGLYVPGRPGGGQDANGQNAPSAADDSAQGSVSGVGTPYDEPVTAETSVLYPDVPIEDVPSTGADNDTSWDAETAAPQPSDPEPSDPEPSSPVNSSPVEYGRPRPAGSRRVPTPPRVSGPGSPAHGSEDDGNSSITPEPSQAEFVSEPEAPTPEAPSSAEPEDSTDAQDRWDLPEARPRRRRRADADSDTSAGAHSNGRSVAEIMAGLNSNSSESSDSANVSEPSERRRRRRAD